MSKQAIKWLKMKGLNNNATTYTIHANRTSISCTFNTIFLLIALNEIVFYLDKSTHNQLLYYHQKQIVFAQIVFHDFYLTLRLQILIQYKIAAAIEHLKFVIITLVSPKIILQGKLYVRGILLDIRSNNKVWKNIYF